MNEKQLYFHMTQATISMVKHGLLNTLDMLCMLLMTSKQFLIHVSQS